MPAFTCELPVVAGRLRHIFCAAVLIAALGLVAAQRAAALTTFAQGTTATSLPSGAASDSDSFFFETSCGAPGSCVAVGDYKDTTGGVEAAVEPITNGTPGSAVEVTLPSGAPTGASQNAELYDVSCWAAGSCDAVGYYKDSAGNDQALVVPISGGTVGTGVEVSPPSNASTTFIDNSLNGVSCWSAGSSGSCIAVGSYNYGTNSPQALAVPITNGTTVGTGVQVVLPTNASTTDDDADLQDVSCWSAGSCIAVGSYNDTLGNSQALVVPFSNSSAETGLEPAEPGNAIAAASGDQYAYLNYVNCPAAGSCAAVGAYTDSSDHTQPLDVPVSNSTPGGGAEIALPSDAATGGNNDLNGVSCSSYGSCDAVGYYVNNAGNTEALVAPIANGTPGTSVELPLPSDATGSSQDAGLNDVSCVAGGQCLAVGYYLNSSSKNEALALPLSGSSIGTATEVAAPSESSSAPFSAFQTVGCSSAGSCAAVGDEDNSSNVYAPYVTSFESALAIGTTSISEGALSTAYQTTLAATGAWDSYSWSISSGSLPAGLSLNSQTGVISGTPTASGNSTFTVQATGAGVPTQTATETLSLNVLAPLLTAPNGALRSKSNRVSVSLACTDAPCAGVLTLETTELVTIKRGKRRIHKRLTVVIGSEAFSLAAGASGDITVTVNGRGRELLNAAKGHHLQVTVLTNTTDGNVATRSTRLTETLPKAKHHKKKKKKK